MLEVFADNEFTVGVQTPNAQIYAVKSGVYRVDVLGDGTAKLEVWEGRAQIGDSNATIVKEGREATVNNSQVTVAKFDRDEKDSLEIWSKSRAKELAKVNSRLEQNALRNTLISSYQANTWNWYNSFGLWIYDASISNYCFLPFGYGWSSPYGYYFGWNAWNIRLPRYYYYYPPAWVNGNSNTANNGSGNGNNGNNSGNTNGQGMIKDNKPPFQQIQNSGGTRVIRDTNPVFVDENPFPSVISPSSRPVIIVPSSPTGTKRRGQ